MRDRSYVVVYMSIIIMFGHMVSRHHDRIFGMEPLDLEDYLLAAESILDRPAEQMKYVVQIGLAESALAAPFASFGGIDFYPEPYQKAAVLCSRIARNHALPDGNKRVAIYLLIDFVLRNGYDWTEPAGGQDEIARVIEDVAAADMTEDALALGSASVWGEPPWAIGGPVARKR
jgi:death-on-curing protein